MSRISVIVPVYNTEKYLGRCIESVQKQTFKDWELILVDDGSDDGSGSICDRYGKGDGRIKVFHNQNQGPAASREAGIKQASGERIMFVDSDDWLDENMLKLMDEQMNISGANMVCCIFKDIDDAGRISHPQMFKENCIDCQTAQECMYQIHHTRYLTGSPCTKLFRKELFDEVDFCSNVTIGEDYSMIVQLAEKAESVRILPWELYFRYVRKGSISHGGFSERHKQAFDNYMKVRMMLIRKYPDLASDIIAFHTEYEMAVITAMCRNDKYDKEVIGKLKADLRENMRNTLGNEKIPLYMKGCAVMIAYVHPVFIFLFRILYHLTGR